MNPRARFFKAYQSYVPYFPDIGFCFMEILLFVILIATVCPV